MGHRNKQLISYQMPQVIINHLEPVQIQKEDGKGVIFICFGPLERLLQPFHKKYTVGQTGQGVMQRVVDQLVLIFFTSRNIGLRAGETISPSFHVSDRKTLAQDPAIIPFMMQHPVLASKVGRCPFEVKADVQPETSQVFRVDPVEPFFYPGRYLFFGVT